MSITEIFSKGLDNKKFQIDDKISGEHNKVVAVGFNKNGNLGVIAMDRPLKSQHTMDLINASTRNWNAEHIMSADGMSK